MNPRPSPPPRGAGAGPRPRLELPPDRESRFRGCLLAGAAGDALGAPVEFLDLPAIHARYGPGGIRDLAAAYGRSGGAITDDTQMTLFTAEGLLRARVKARSGGPDAVPATVSHAYQRWLITQGVQGRAREVGRDGWLFTQKALFSSRAPGNTCLSALCAYEHFAQAVPPGNHSKGCGGVMRMAPVGLYVAALGLPARQAFTWGVALAALTHGHPTGQLPAGVLAMVVAGLVLGRPLPAALAEAKEVLREQPEHGETLDALLKAEHCAAAPGPTEALLPLLGQGWVADEALAIALCCALRARTLEEGVIEAANLTGDSDSTAAIAGNLLGAMLGVREVPERWLDVLEMKTVITEMADDLASVAEWGGTNGAQPEAYWTERYPGW